MVSCGASWFLSPLAGQQNWVQAPTQRFQVSLLHKFLTASAAGDAFEESLDAEGDPGKLERGEELAFSASTPVPQKAGLCADHTSSVSVVLANLSGCTAAGGAFRLSRSKRPLRSAGKMTGALD